MINQNLLLAGDDGYNLTNSLRFRSSASAWLNRTPASSSNLNTWTISWWTKRGQLSTPAQTTMFGTNYVSDQEFMLQFTANNRFVFEQYASGGVINLGSLTTTQVFRDPSAWYHFVVTWDSTQATAANRIKIYVNGVQITAFDTAVYPSQNASSVWNQATNQHRIGQYSTAKYYDGYMGETHFIDGQALTPSSFGETDVLTGVWKPKKYAGTYGTNGFYLPFTDVATTSGSNAGLGKDFSGNGNYWTTNNISITAGVTYDSMTDVPTLTSATTANYCVVSPIAYRTTTPTPTISNGNLTVVCPSASLSSIGSSTFGVSSGKWYWETTKTGTSYANTGVALAPFSQTISSSFDFGSESNEYAYVNNGSKFNSNSLTSYGASYTNGDVIGVALDLDNGTLTFYKNNTSQGVAFSSLPSGTYIVGCYDSFNGSGFQFNFGQRPFAYTPPTGFVALNTFNLPSSTIVAGNKQMDATTYTGTGATRTVVNAGGMQPDLVWTKARSAAIAGLMYDSVRGATKYLQVNSSNAEGTGSDSLTAFASNGFTVGADTSTTGVNQNGTTYVGWQWKAGGAAVTNTAGTISAQVSANPTAGFSVVTYTGTGTSGATVGHGLGVAPSMVIVKFRKDVAADGPWYVYHSSLGATKNLILNTTAAEATASTPWNNTAPSSSVFSLGNAGDTNGSGRSFVAYCWSEVAGYSKFGSYTGNGSADGTFVFTGFRPKFVMIKRSSSAESWVIEDTSRDAYNLTVNKLYANTSTAEDAGNTYGTMDILSNGFKLRASHPIQNTSGETYIYACFAESPFKTSLAR